MGIFQRKFVVNGDIPKKICGKWGYSKENFGTTCRGVGASFPQNVSKVLHFHLHKTTVIHKLCNAVCEARLNFMNEYLMLKKSATHSVCLMVKIGSIYMDIWAPRITDICLQKIP